MSSPAERLTTVSCPLHVSENALIQLKGQKISMTINSKFPFEILWSLRNYHIVYLKNNIKPCGEKLEVLQLKCASKKVALFKESIVASKHFLETGRNSCSWCEFPVSRNNCSHAQSHCLDLDLKMRRSTQNNVLCAQHNKPYFWEFPTITQYFSIKHLV